VQVCDNATAPLSGLSRAQSMLLSLCVRLINVWRMTNRSIQIEYNQDFEPLEQLLSGVERAGDFFVSGTVEVPMPKLEVEGVGVVSFPVPPNQIAALIGQATRAPYGRGEATSLMNRSAKCGRCRRTKSA